MSVVAVTCAGLASEAGRVDIYKCPAAGLEDYLDSCVSRSFVRVSRFELRLGQRQDHSGYAISGIAGRLRDRVHAPAAERDHMRIVDDDLDEAMAGKHILFGSHEAAIGTQLHFGLTERAVREERYSCPGLVHRSAIADNPITS